MDAKYIALAKECMQNNRDKLLENAVNCCVFHDDDVSTDTFTRYEKLLNDMAEMDHDAEAAIRYLTIALYDNCENVFDVDQGIQLVLETQALDAYVEYIEKEYQSVFDQELLTSMIQTVFLRIAEISRMSAEADSQ